MHTSSNFSGTRFGRFLRLYLTQHGRLFGYSVLGAYLIFALFYIFTASVQYNFQLLNNKLEASTQIYDLTVFFACMVLFPIAAIVGSHLMHSISNKRNRLNTLTLPATALEKYLSFWLIHVLFFFVAYIFIVVGADITRTVLCSMFYPSITNIHPTEVGPIIEQAPEGMVSILIISYLFIQSYFMLGSTIWRKYSFFKTFSITLLLLIITVSVIILTTSQYTQNHSSGFDFIEFLNEWKYLFVVPVVFNWTMTYFRFKEAELIHHV